MADVVIVDYRMGNLRSVSKALEIVGNAGTAGVAGTSVLISSDPREIARADRLILPGVGAFQDAMTALRAGGLDEAVKAFIDTGRPFLGICLGLQLLFDVGMEDGEHQGLGIIAGKCLPMDDNMHDCDGRRLKIPHMGWNSLTIERRSPILNDIPDGADVYFVHSYAVLPDDPRVISTTTNYGRSFVSSIWRDNIAAVQFHPEKSQRHGLKMLANFLGQ